MPSTVTVSRDPAERWFVSLSCEDSGLRPLPATDAVMGIDAGLDHLLVVDRWFPSSKMCSACGALVAAMPLHLRMWKCAGGAIHDRDVNAARDILAAGPAVTVCGAGVRPQRNPPGGQSATKQRTPRREP